MFTRTFIVWTVSFAVPMLVLHTNKLHQIFRSHNFCPHNLDLSVLLPHGIQDNFLGTSEWSRLTASEIAKIFPMFSRQTHDVIVRDASSVVHFYVHDKLSQNIPYGYYDVTTKDLFSQFQKSVSYTYGRVLKTLVGPGFACQQYLIFWHRRVCS